jgi:5'(3')-deoxyribonucleotidase
LDGKGSLKKIYFEGRRSLMQACHICNQADFPHTVKDFWGEKPLFYPQFNWADNRFIKIFGMIRS